MKNKHSSLYLAVTAFLLLAGTVSLAKVMETKTVMVANDSTFTLASRGDVYDLSAKDADLQEVLRAIRKESGIGLKIDQDLKGKVTLDLKGVSLQELLNALVKSGSMVFEQKDGAYELVSATVTSQQKGDEPELIVPAGPMSDEERASLKAQGILCNSSQSLKSLLRKGQPSIVLQNAVIDVGEIRKTGKHVEVPEELKADENTEYYIVQFDHPAGDAEKQSLADAGATVSHYVPNWAYAVHATSDALDKIRQMSGVQHVEPYHPYYKLSKDILAYATGLEQAGDASRVNGGRFNVMLFRGAEMPAILKSPDVEIVKTQETGGRQVVTVKCSKDKLMELVKADSLQWIEPDMPRMPMNDLASKRIRANSLKTLHPTLTGEGVIIGVTDTGIDFVNRGFAVNDLLPTTTGLNSRIHYYEYRTGGLTSDGLPGDNNGHGTHVSGSILGNGAFSGTASKVPGSGVAPFGPYQFAGMAPGAKVVMLEDFNSFTDVEQTKISYGKGARLSNNSWGNSLYEYGTMSAAWDALVRDADPSAAGNQEYITFFAAGNAGNGSDNGTGGSAGTVGEPGNAKNVITVGAVEQLRRANNIMNVTVGTTTIRSEDETDSDWQVASFSSRGPVTATDLRVKPDIVAPGAYVMSIQSHETSPDDYEYSGDINMDYRYGNVDSGTNFALFSGTSMATPVAAGGAALIYQYCTNVLGKVPSPALMKAMMVNGARMLNSMVYKHAPLLEADPVVDQGWGMLDVVRATDGTRVFDSSRVEVLDQTDTTALNTATEYSRQIYLNGSEGGLKITLAYTDIPGTPGNGVQLVNDLDLYVMAPGGGGYQGNLFDVDGVHSYKLSELNAAYGDAFNNVETIVIPGGVRGTYTIKVMGYSVPSGPQDFALVIMQGIGLEGRTEGNNPDIAMTADDHPVVAYSYDWSTDGSTSNLDRQVYVKKWMGDAGDLSELGSWKRLDDQWYEIRGSGSGQGVSKTMENSENPAVAVDGDRIFLAWQEMPQNQVPGNYSHIFFKMFDGTNWVELGNSARDVGVSRNTAFEISEPMVGVAWDGQPIVAWQQAGDNPNLSRIMLAKWDGANWVGLAGSNSNGVPSPAATKLASYPSMVINNSGYPVVAWREDTNPDGIVVQRWTGAAWTSMNVPDSSPVIDYPRLGKDVNGNLYITWVQTYGSNPGSYSSYQVYAMRSSGGAWSAVGGSTTFPGLSAATNASLKPFSPAIQGSFNGNIVVAWQAGETNNAILVKEWVARRSVWTNMGASTVWPGIAPVGGVSADPRMAVNSAGVPFVAFRNLSEDIGSSEIMTYSYITDSTPPEFDGLQRAVGSTNGTVTLSWLSATDNLSTTIVYYVYRGTQSWACGGQPDCNTDDVFSNRIAIVTNVTTYVVSGLTPNQVWCFGVRAVDQRDLIDDNTSTRSAGPVTGAGDNDGDCLDNAAELAAGTEPCIPDTDGDGMSDGWEWTWSPANGVVGGMDPLDNGTDNLGTLASGDGDADQLPNADIDDDGATSFEEYRWWLSNIHTGASCTGVFSPTNSPDPTNDDTDGDGMIDGWEMVNGLNPVVAGDGAADPDGDGLTNLQESQFNTDPYTADSDGDGLNDGAEVNTHGSDPALSDTDLDGLDDGYEVANGTDPADADSNDNFINDGAVVQLGLGTNIAWNLLLTESFETSTRTNWTHRSINAAYPNDLWHLSQVDLDPNTSGVTYLNDRSPNVSYRFANDTNMGTNASANYSLGKLLQAALISPYIEATNASNLYMAWNEYFETEPNWDRVSVQARGGENTNWFTVSAAQWGKSGLEEDENDQSARWTHRTADLSQFAGMSNVQVRFLFSALNSINNGFAGWFVDDVRVYESALITGWVRDINGAPLKGVTVQAIGKGPVTQYVDGHKYLLPGSIFGESITADDGSYALGGLPMGQYYVKASHPKYAAEFYDGMLYNGTYAFGSSLYPGVQDISLVNDARGRVALMTAGSTTNCDFELELGKGRANVGVVFANPGNVRYNVMLNGCDTNLTAKIWDGSSALRNYVTYYSGVPSNNLPDWISNPVRPQVLGDLALGDHVLFIGDSSLPSYPLLYISPREGETVVVDVRTNQPVGYLDVRAEDGGAYDIWLDGRDAGVQTPARMTVLAGAHEVFIDLGAAKTAPKAVRVPVADRILVEFAEDETDADTGIALIKTVDVFGNPLGAASFFLNGELLGTAGTGTVSWAMDLLPGKYFVNVTRDGYRYSERQALTVKSGVTNTATFVLYQADRDYDLVGDGTEVDGYSDIFLYDREDDPDADGLNNLFEFQQYRLYGVILDVFDPDSDRDAMLDGEELGFDGFTNLLARSTITTNTANSAPLLQTYFVGSYLAGVDNFGNGSVKAAVECDHFAAAATAHPLLGVPTVARAQSVFTNIPFAVRESALTVGHNADAVVLADTMPDTVDTDGDGMWDGFEYQYQYMGTARILNPIECAGLEDDPDFDGLSNYEEFLGPDNAANTNDWSDPANADSDGDGIPDGWEYFYGYDPNDAADAAMDSDEDGLNSLREYQEGTNPGMEDTDADGLPDLQEVDVYNTNPLEIDTDYDGLIDGREVWDRNMDGLQDGGIFPSWNGGDLDWDGYIDGPTDWDTDGDGMSDGWEVMDEFGNFRNDPRLDPYNPFDADEDPDGDGLSNLEEYLVRDALFGNPPASFDPVNYAGVVWDYTSDPFNPDSDGDGLPDGFEVLNGLHPMDPIPADYDEMSTRYPLLGPDGDLDMDGLWNLREYRVRFQLDASADEYSVVSLSTHPWNSDTDNDGLSDGEEDRALRSNPVVQDSDQDGLVDGMNLGGKWGEVDTTYHTNVDYAIYPAGDTNWTWFDAYFAAEATPHPEFAWNIYGSLAGITSQEENDLITNLFTGAETNIAIGGYNDGSDSNAWTWVNGDGFEFTNFAGGVNPWVLSNEMFLDINTAGEWEGDDGTEIIDSYVVEWRNLPAWTGHYDRALNDMWTLKWTSPDKLPHWERLEPTGGELPPSRWGASMTYVPVFETKKERNNDADASTVLLDNRKLVVIGGRDGVTRHRDVWEYSIADGSWASSIAPLYDPADPMSMTAAGLMNGLSEHNAIMFLGYKDTKDCTGCDNTPPYDCDADGFLLPKKRPWSSGSAGGVSRSFDWTYIFGGWDETRLYYGTFGPSFYKSTDDDSPITESVRTDIDVYEAFERYFNLDGTPVQPPFGVGIRSLDEEKDDVMIGGAGIIFSETNETQAVQWEWRAAAFHFGETPFSDCETIESAELIFDITTAPAGDLDVDLIFEVKRSLNASPEEYEDAEGSFPPSERASDSTFYQTVVLPVTIPGGTAGEFRVDVTALITEILASGEWGPTEDWKPAVGVVITSSDTDIAWIADKKTKLEVTYTPSYKIDPYWESPTGVAYVKSGATDEPSHPNRKNAGLVLDYGRERDTMILFGGIDGNEVLGDTWEGTVAFNSSFDPRRITWTRQNIPGPSPRWGHSMVYDPQNQRVVLFGGFDAQHRPLNDLWVYTSGEGTPFMEVDEETGESTTNYLDGGTWTEVTAFTDPERPQPRGGASMVYCGGYDYDRAIAEYSATDKKMIVLFGGTDGNNYFNDTWVYDGSRWTLVNPVGEQSQSPEPRAFASMTWCQNIQKVYGNNRSTKGASGAAVLFGGRAGALPTGTDTDADMVDDGIEHMLGGRGAGRDPRVNALVPNSAWQAEEAIPFAFARIGSRPSGLTLPPSPPALIGPPALPGAIANFESLRHSDGMYACTYSLPWEMHPDPWASVSVSCGLPGQGVEALLSGETTLWYHRFGGEDPFDVRDVWELGMPDNLALPDGVPPYAHSGRWVYGTDVNGSYPNDARMELYSPLLDLTIPQPNGTSTNGNNRNSYFLVFYEWLDLADSNDVVMVDAIRPVEESEVLQRKPGLAKPVLPVLPARNNAFNTKGKWRKVVQPLDMLANESKVYLRFTLQSDSSRVAGGWTIDDVAVLQAGEINGENAEPGAQMLLLGQNDMGVPYDVTTADENGFFQFGLLPAGSYVIDGYPVSVSADASAVQVALLTFDDIESMSGTRDISWMAQDGWTYTIEYTTDFVTWTVLAPPSPVTPGAGLYTYSDPSGDPLRIYRIWGIPPP